MKLSVVTLEKAVKEYRHKVGKVYKAGGTLLLGLASELL